MQTIEKNNTLKKFILTTLLLSPFFIQGLFAQLPGDNDPAFNPSDIGFGNGDGANVNGVSGTYIQTDGKIIICGDFLNYNGTPISGVARLNIDGTLDNTFNTGTGADAAVYVACIQTDGKILIGGSFTSFNGTARNHIARLNSDGSLDGNFDPGSGADNDVLAITHQPDGKILVGGDFQTVNGTTKKGIARLNADGSLETAFNLGSGANGRVNNIVLEPFGQIYIAGYFTSYNGTIRNRIARLNANGTLDGTFLPTGAGANDDIMDIQLVSDSKVIVAGYFTTFNGIAKTGIARLDSTGGVDNTFNNSGVGPDASLWTVALQSDNKLIITGVFSSYNGTFTGHMARLNANGSLDGTYLIDAGPDNPAYATAVQSDNKLIIGGSFWHVNGNIERKGVARLNTDGSLDMTFNPGSGANNIVRASSVQTDGKVLLGGNFSIVNGTIRRYLARLESDGDLDAGFDFGTGGTGPDGTVYLVAPQSDGRILIGGDFAFFNGTFIKSVAYLNSDGSLDNSFAPAPGADEGVLTGFVQPDGQVVIGGRFSNYNGTPISGVARLNTDGTLDMNFDPGTGSDGSPVLSVVLQPDDKIIVCGQFTTFNGTTANSIVRLNDDGSIDNSFTPGSGATGGYIATCALQSDGKIIIAGSFDTYDGVPCARIARLNSDGSLDTSFDPGAGANGTIESCTIQSNGKIVIGGSFTSYDGVPRNFIATLNANGSLDNVFDPGTGADMDVFTTTMQTDEKIIIGGMFTSYDGAGRNRIARVYADTSCNAIIEGTVSSQQSGTLSTGKVYLIQTDTPDNLWDTISVATIQVDGSYSFSDVPDMREYIILATPDILANPNCMPTYFGDTIFWEFATHITPACGAALVKNITVKENAPGGGNCDFTGTVYLYSTGKTLTTDPIPLIDVVVKKTPPGNGIAYTTTDGNGQFTFNDVLASDSTYSFYVNIPGMVMWENYTITVGPGDALYDSLNFYVDTASGPGAGIYTTDPLTTKIGSVSKNHTALLVYPNPFNTYCEFIFPNESNANFTFTLYDLSGKLIIKDDNLSGSSYSLRPQDLERGVYIAEITTAIETFRSRVVKQDQ